MFETLLPFRSCRANWSRKLFISPKVTGGAGMLIREPHGESEVLVWERLRTRSSQVFKLEDGLRRWFGEESVCHISLRT